MSELTKELSEEITRMVNDDIEPMDVASWIYQHGMLLTGEQAQELLADIEVLEMRLDEAHEALIAVHESGVNLQEHENTVRAALGLVAI